MIVYVPIKAQCWGVEARVPFLDQEFPKYCNDNTPRIEMRESIEKWCLREAFNTPDNPYLPDSVLWRQKEQFSDGVGYNWIDSLREYAETQVTRRIPVKQVRVTQMRTPEAVWYKNIYDSLFQA